MPILTVTEFKKKIYVRLLDEGVDVWRPVEAEQLPPGTYRILEQPYDRVSERWEFTPGDKVVCELVDSTDGRILAATGRSD